MGNIISYDTEEMGLWSGNVSDAATSFVDEVGSLYKLIDEFVADDFTGNTSEEFKALTEGVRPKYEDNYDIINECAKLIQDSATNYADNDAALQREINNSSVF